MAGSSNYMSPIRLKHLLTDFREDQVKNVMGVQIIQLSGAMIQPLCFPNVPVSAPGRH